MPKRRVIPVNDFKNLPSIRGTVPLNRIRPPDEYFRPVCIHYVPVLRFGFRTVPENGRGNVNAPAGRNPVGEVFNGFPKFVNVDEN
jgi:hypothetical protein